MPASARTRSAPTPISPRRWSAWCSARGGADDSGDQHAIGEARTAMRFGVPFMLVVAVVVVAGLVLAYRALDRRRTAALAVLGAPGSPATRSRRAWLRRHLPPLLFLAGLATLL